MTGYSILRAMDRVDAPWKNGGGRTSEVCALRRHPGMDDFDWRISIAEVTGSGPFSSFAGMDRVLVVLEGELDLLFEGEEAPIHLTKGSAPFPFPGDVAVVGNPSNTPVKDLNVIVRRGRARATVQRVTLCSHQQRILNASDGEFLVSQGDISVSVGGRHENLGNLDVIQCHGDIQLIVRADAEADILLVAIVIT
jgi:environmental stress-induced protein Ves